MERLNILVTGGAGFIGSQLVDALIGAGHRVRVFDKLVPQVRGEAGPRYVNEAVEFIHGDVADRAAVERSLEAIDVVHHQAAWLAQSSGSFIPSRRDMRSSYPSRERAAGSRGSRGEGDRGAGREALATVRGRAAAETSM